MTWLFYLGCVLAAFIGMEFMAWFTHKYLMHGPLWSWHEDHHKPHENDGFFEKNDRFFLVFAIPSAACYMLGSFYPELRFLLYIGIGISLYGLTYFLIHDVYIHQRFKWFRQLESPYSKAILRAHGAHHAVQTKEDCESFGLLIVAKKYFKSRSQRRKAQTS
ncbi:sterol desaturase family protein [Portibacter marinus]|uniref:sterol desaturase family protein n=1 Tax=Portibacter marinus TaxID=2898660 RepID=UPI001F1D32A5|nr:sterol desaturase family protein [Portibacter marinus]